MFNRFLFLIFILGIPAVHAQGTQECPVPDDGQSWYNACYNWLGYTKPFTSNERRVIKECVSRCEGSDPEPPPPPPPPDGDVI